MRQWLVYRPNGPDGDAEAMVYQWREDLGAPQVLTISPHLVGCYTLHVEATWPADVGPEGMIAYLSECYPDAEAIEEITSR